MEVFLKDFDLRVIVLHVLLSTGILAKSHLFYELVDHFLWSSLHLCSDDVVQWPALTSFMETMKFSFGESAVNLLTGLHF